MTLVNAISKTGSLLPSIATGALLVSATVASAQDVQQTNSGSSTFNATTHGASVDVFDRVGVLVKPENLDIKDTYIKDIGTEAQIASRLSMVSVTREGIVETQDAGIQAARAHKADLERFVRALESLEPENKPEVLRDRGQQENDAFFVEPGASAESVIGRDTRVRVRSTTRFPFRAIGSIDIGCTGTLIGPRHVLTAGHCVFNADSKRWYRNLNFTPGRNGNYKPFGTVGWTRAITTRGWTDRSLRSYDYAMIVLNEDIGRTRTGWMGFTYRSQLPKYNVNIIGYPGDKPANTQWGAFCRLRHVTPSTLFYPCDTYNGMSGSAVYVKFRDNRRFIVGVHAYGVDGTGYNSGARLHRSAFDNLRRWKARY